MRGGIALNLFNRKRMPAGPGWPGLVVAVVSLFGVGPVYYRFRGGFVCVFGSVLLLPFAPQPFFDRLIP